MTLYVLGKPLDEATRKRDLNEEYVVWSMGRILVNDNIDLADDDACYLCLYKYFESSYIDRLLDRAKIYAAHRRQFGPTIGSEPPHPAQDIA